MTRKNRCPACGKWHAGHCSKSHYRGLDAANVRTARLDDDPSDEKLGPPKAYGQRLEDGMAIWQGFALA